MDNLLKEIRRVQRRLAAQHFSGVLGWCWFGSLLAAAIAIGAARIWPLAEVTHIRDWHWLAGFMTTGLMVAIAWTLCTMPPSIRAALEIDRRCGLKERVSSALAINPAERESEAGQALIADADAKLRRTAVLEKFPVRLPRYLLLPAFPAAVVLLTIIIWSPAQRQVAAVTDPTADPQAPLAIQKSADDLQTKLAQVRKQNENKEGLKDATDLLKKVEEGVNELKSQTDREKALVKLNELARELQQRQKQLGGKSESLWKRMEQMDKVDSGPADKLKNALAKNDFAKAAKELEQLQKKLSGEGLDDKQKQELAKQMEQLKQKLDQLAQQQKQDQAEMQKQAEQLKQPGGDANAAHQLEEEIQKMQQQGPQMESLKNLANKLGQCASRMKQGKGNQAAQSMQDALSQMQEMAQKQSEMQSMNDALQAIADARKQMTCEKCGGKGCKECQGESEAEAGSMGQGQGKGDKDGKPGPGMGEGAGNGARPEAPADGRFYNSRVAQKVGKGTAQVTGLTDGPNLKNQAESEIQQATTAIEHGNTDPLSGQHLPKKQSEHVQQYFDSFREGK